MAEAGFSRPEFPELLGRGLDPRWPVAVAAQWTVLRYLSDMLDQREAAYRAEETEGVHQIRVAARRVRTALQTFRNLWPGREVQSHLELFGSLADIFTAARDLDVMIEYLEAQIESASRANQPALRSLLETARRDRAAEQPQIRGQLEMLERSKLPAKLVRYFSANPCDLAEFARSGRLQAGHGAQREARPAAAKVAEQPHG